MVSCERKTSTEHKSKINKIKQNLDESHSEKTPYLLLKRLICVFNQLKIKHKIKCTFYKFTKTLFRMFINVELMNLAFKRIIMKIGKMRRVYRVSSRVCVCVCTCVWVSPRIISVNLISLSQDSDKVAFRHMALSQMS